MTNNSPMRNKMTEGEFETITVDATVLEEEAGIPKVLLLKNQRVLKLFRRKRLISSQIWAPYALRFKRNSERLSQREIASVQVERCFSLPHINRQCVLYRHLDGEPLRKWFAQAQAEEHADRAKQLGCVIADLHRKGVLFRSIHFNNILVLHDGELALIDITDLSFRWFQPLNTSQRIRNFHHMDRVDVDRNILAGHLGDRFIESYLQAAQLPERTTKILRNAFSSIFSKYKK